MARAGALRALLAGYQAHDQREDSFLSRMLHLTAAERPFDRAAFEPGHFTASAFVLSPERDEVLLILHGKLGIWVQPGGHVEPNDLDLEGAARREVGEEVGLEDVTALGPGPFDLDVHPIPARRDEPAHEHFDVRFLFVAPHRDVRWTAEVRDVRWVPFAELDSFATDESVRRAVRKITGGFASRGRVG